MKGKKRVLYSNYCNEGYYNGIKMCLTDDKTIPTDEQIWNAYYRCQENEWEDFKYSVEEYFNSHTFIITGDIQRWNGISQGGYVFTGFDGLFRAIEDEFEIYDENGHLFLKTSHHDGTNCFEIKELTSKGEDYEYRNRDIKSPREVHKALMSRYSRLPNLAHRFYGYKLREYEK